MAIDIRPIGDAAEHLAVLRQRYAIYVEELGYAQPHADAAARTVAEPMDAGAVLFGAFDGPRLLASARVNYGDAGAETFGPLAQAYGLQRYGPWFPRGIGIVTKMMIEREHRAGTLLARMGLALYRWTQRTRPHTMFCVIDCVPGLVACYRRLGYRPVGAPFRHPAAGPVQPMALAVYDLAHLRRVRSPLAAACPRHDEATARWLDSIIDEAAAPVETRWPPVPADVRIDACIPSAMAGPMSTPKEHPR